jgi:mRNA interferase RelE/StbE
LNLDFKKSFVRDLKRVSDNNVLLQLRQVIQDMEKAASITAINNLKKLSSGSAHYRIKLGDYRIGLVLEKDKAVFVRILHRKEIYRYFP